MNIYKDLCVEGHVYDDKLGTVSLTTHRHWRVRTDSNETLKLLEGISGTKSLCLT